MIWLFVAELRNHLANFESQMCDATTGKVSLCEKVLPDLLKTRLHSGKVLIDKGGGNRGCSAGRSAYRDGSEFEIVGVDLDFNRLSGRLLNRWLWCGQIVLFTGIDRRKSFWAAVE